MRFNLNRSAWTGATGQIPIFTPSSYFHMRTRLYCFSFLLFSLTGYGQTVDFMGQPSSLNGQDIFIQQSSLQPSAQNQDAGSEINLTQAGVGNRMRYTNLGLDNRTTLNQAGDGNRLELELLGNGNIVTLSQLGNENELRIINAQDSGVRFEATQIGDNNLLIKEGLSTTGVDMIIEQRGGMQLIVTNPF